MNTKMGTSPPTLLSISRALYRVSKDTKRQYFRAELLAVVLAIGAAVSPSDVSSALFGIAAVAAKFAAKLLSSNSRASYRLAERRRRYDFEERTLGWPTPPSERADLRMESSPVLALARTFEPRDASYYAKAGPPSTELLLGNLSESVFWTSRQMALMEKSQFKVLAGAAGAVVAILVASVLSSPQSAGAIVLKLLAMAVAFLVAVDVYGEARSFGRGARECDRLLMALTAEAGRAAPSRDEAIRLFIEYNCTLADLPVIPDWVYEKHGTQLDAAWSEYARAASTGLVET